MMVSSEYGAHTSLRSTWLVNFAHRWANRQVDTDSLTKGSSQLSVATNTVWQLPPRLCTEEGGEASANRGFDFVWLAVGNEGLPIDLCLCVLTCPGARRSLGSCGRARVGGQTLSLAAI